MITAICAFSHGCAFPSSPTVLPKKVTLFGDAAPLAARASRDSALLFGPVEVNPASFMRAEWPSTARTIDEGRWRVTVRDQQGDCGDHYSRVFRSIRHGHAAE